MAEFIIDSWNNAQLARLRDFFVHSAKQGDTVIFDRVLAEKNAPSLEGLDDDGCNSFVIRCANMALEGLPHEDMNRIADTVKLTTRYLHGIPDPAPLQNQGLESQALFEEDEDYDADIDLMEPASKTKSESDNDAAAAEWAATLARYHSRTPEMS